MAVLRKPVPPGPLATLQAETMVYYARVEGVDCAARTVSLRSLEPAGTYVIDPGVSRWQSLRVGDSVNARIRLELSVYIPAATDDPHRPAARVLNVDQSFRILTLQYADGQSDDFKVDLETPLDKVMPGASVDFRPLKVPYLVSLMLRPRGDTAGECTPVGDRSSP